MRLVIGNARGPRYGPNIKQMMDDALPLVVRKLRGSDIHALVQLHRVGVYNLAVQAMREIDAELRLARSGRAKNDDEFHAGSHEATVYMTP